MAAGTGRQRRELRCTCSGDSALCCAVGRQRAERRIAVNALGYSHPHLIGALERQGRKLWHLSNVYRISETERLAERLTAACFADVAFFANSGAEANECAIKIARMYGHGRNIEKPAIIVMENSFHGRTLATLSATGSRKVQAGFEPLVSGFVRARFGELEELAIIARNNSSIVAVLVEPIQGENAVVEPPSAFLGGVRRLTRRHGAPLWVDEVQTGLGRYGAWLAPAQPTLPADIARLAKALGTGFPAASSIRHLTVIFRPGSWSFVMRIFSAFAFPRMMLRKSVSGCSAMYCGSVRT